MTIGFLQIDLLIRDAHSLKDKRSILLRLKNQLRSKLNIAIAEIGLNDQMRRAVLGITTIGNEQDIVQQTLASAERIITSNPAVQIVQRQMEML
jgi:uncharacterized protein YlxP (DUF503 family)